MKILAVALIVMGLMVTDAEDEDQRDVRSINELRRKKVLFHATLRRGVTHYLKTGEVVKMDTVYQNIGGGYNRYSGVFTVPYSGFYLFYASFLITNRVNTGGEVLLKHNNYIKMKMIAENKGHNSHVQPSGSLVVYCRKNDRIWLSAWNRGNNFRINGYDFSSFGGYRLPFY